MKSKINGFTLIELIVIVMVIAILGLIAVPNLVSGIPAYRLKSAAMDLWSNMRKARSMALKQNRNITITFDVDNKKYLIDDQPPWPQEYNSFEDYYGSGVMFGKPGSPPGDPVTFTGDKVTFNSQGHGNVGYVYITNSSRLGYRIGVRTIAGSIVLQQWSENKWK